MNGELFWLGVYIAVFVLSTVAVIQIIAGVWLKVHRRIKKADDVDQHSKTHFKKAA